MFVLKDMAEPLLQVHDENPSAGLFTLEGGRFGGKTYGTRFSICESPLCGCTAINFASAPVPDPNEDSQEDEAGKMAIYGFSVDVAERSIVDTGTPENREFGVEFVGQLTPDDWQFLVKYLLEGKAEQIREADLDQLDPEFPQAAFERAMVGYKEIFPLSPEFSLEKEGKSYLVDDMYCVQPKCDCNEAVLTFFTKDSGGSSSLDEIAAVRYSLTSGLKEILPGKQSRSLTRRLVEALEVSTPDLKPDLAFRYSQLKKLFLKVSPPSRPIELPKEAKVGRNAPCPCGSGKKYKKCCGA